MIVNLFLAAFLVALGIVEVYGVLRHFQQYFSYIVAVSFIGGGNRVLGENHDLPIQYVIKRTASISYIANYPCISKR
jgi:hypothetical protein